MLKLGKFYLVERMVQVLYGRIEELSVTMENLLQVLLTVLPYKSLDGFEHALRIVGDKVTAAFTLLSVKDQNTFYRQHRTNNRDVVEYLVDLVAAKDHSKPDNGILLLCDECKTPADECKHAEEEVDLEDIFTHLKSRLTVGHFEVRELSSLVTEHKEPNRDAMKVVVSTFARLQSRELNMFFKNHREEYSDMVDAIIDLIAEFQPKKKPGISCSNCRFTKDKCIHGQLVEGILTEEISIIDTDGYVSIVNSVEVKDNYKRNAAGVRKYRVKLSDRQESFEEIQNESEFFYDGGRGCRSLWRCCNDPMVVRRSNHSAAMIQWFCSDPIIVGKWLCGDHKFSS